MSLDVWLYQFKDVDTDALLKLWQFSEEPWAYEEFETWKALPQAERGIYPSEEAKADSREKLVSKARELGLPESIFEESVFGGNKTSEISFPSTRHPKWQVGQWHSFSTVRELMEYFTGKKFYYVLPEAEGIHGLFRPNWAESRKRLAQILGELKNLTSEQADYFHERFILANIDPAFLEKLGKAFRMTTPQQMLEGCLAQIEVMIETLDFVLNSGNPREFLLYWSD